MKKNINFAIAMIFLALSEMFFFRNVLFCDSQIGDMADGRLTNLVNEHWWSFFTGHESFSEMPIFYPDKYAAGYTDLFLVFGIIHSIFRFFTLDVFSAYKYTLILVHTIGTFTTYYLCRKKLNMSITWSLFGTTAFSFSNAYALLSLHTQLYAVSLLPLLTIFAFDTIKQNLEKENYNTPTYLFLFLFILIMYNSWYISYFSLLFVFIFALIYTLTLLCCKLSIMPFIRRFYELLPDMGKYALFSFILLIPFMYIYIPAIKNTSGFDYSEVFGYIPRLIDLINVGKDNYLLGGLMEKLNLGTGFYHLELIIGFSFVLLSLFLISMFTLCYKTKNLFSDKNVAVTEKYRLLMINCLFLSVVICLLMMTKLTKSEFSLWYFIHNTPGGNSIRAVSRFALWLSFPMSILTAYTADKFLNLPKKIIHIPLMLLVLLWISNATKRGVFSEWNSQRSLNLINRVSPPPAEMEAFFIINDDYGTYFNHNENIDAFIIATVFHVKTINGYSGRAPKDWLLYRKNEYLEQVQNWIKMHNLKNIYTYDVLNDKWQPYGE